MSIIFFNDYMGSKSSMNATTGVYTSYIVGRQSKVPLDTEGTNPQQANVEKCLHGFR
eukprot:m.254214 g.254214  ORF g.254214 m.254214 type:complete len:57 (+) comp17801_c0_seq1:57-227(+)